MKYQKRKKKVDYKNLVYDFTTKGISSINFSRFGGPFHVYNQIKKGNITLTQLEEKQRKFKSELGQIKSGNPDHKSEKQSYTIENVKNLYNLRQKIIDLRNNNSKIRSEAIYKAKKMKLKEQDLKY